MASPELQSKLQRRLLLNKEADTKLITRSLVPDFRRPSFPQALQRFPPYGRFLGEVPAEEDDPPTVEEEELQECINQTALECSEARQQKQSIEAVAVSRGLELGSEVARLRIDVEVLRRDLEAAQSEVYLSRRTTVTEERKERRLKDEAQRKSLEVDAAQARWEEMANEVQGKSQDKDVLEDQVHHLEGEVQQHVFCRVRLEALLRSSEVRENELRRLLEAAEVKAERMGRSPRKTSKAVEATCFSMDLADSGSEEEPQEEDQVEKMETTDLEFSYEGLELPGLMSLERALELARCGTGKPVPPPESPGASSAGASTQEALSWPSSAQSSTAWPSTLAEESLYEAPLRELELAISRLSGSSPGRCSPTRSASNARAAASEAHRAASAGTGETAEPDWEAQVHHLTQLQQTLDRLQAKQEAQSAQAGSSAPSTHAQLQPAAQVPAPTSPPVSPVASTLGLGGLFMSPYARLGQKYGMVRQTS